MTDVNTQAILGTPVAPINPLQILSGWQDYANKVATNAQIQATTDNTIQSTKNAQLANQTDQQKLAQTMVQRHNQIMFGLVNTPDTELPGAAKAALDDELASGQIDPQRASVLQQAFNATGGDPTKIRTLISRGLVSNLGGPQALTALSPGVTDTNVGGQMVARVTPSPLSLATNPMAAGIGNGPGEIDRTQAPGYQESGGQAIPVGGAKGAPLINKTLTPESSTSFQDVLVKNADGSYGVQKIQRGQANPGVAAAGTRGTGIGGGSYPAPAAVTIPLGTESGLSKDQDLYKADQAQIAPLTTGTQSLDKALSALNAVATGAGTEGLAKMRAYAVSLGNVVGVDTGGVNTQDMNRAELEKYLTDYARVSGTAGRSDEAMNAAFKSNASGGINNAAAQDVVRTNIGRDRQKIAATMLQPNPEGSEYSKNKSDYFLNTDPRGFAWDKYTDEQKKAIIKETQGSKGKDSPEYRKLATAIGDAQKLKLLNFSVPQPDNVNASPSKPVIQSPPPQPAQNQIQQMSGYGHGA